MSKVIDLTGNRYGKLIVINRAGSLKGVSTWICLCDCGKTKTVRRGDLNRGLVKSCGCLHSPHKMYGTPENKSWSSMKKRCTDPNHKSWKDYGGRGIVIEDPRWFKFENFFADMGLRPSMMHSLDRVDNSKGYSKENCAWRTKKEQARNRRGNHILELNGESLTLSAWCEKLNLHYNTILNRLGRGWSIEDTLTRPIGYQNMPHSGRFKKRIK